MRGPAATRRRSTRRSSATPSRPRSSRTSFARPRRARRRSGATTRFASARSGSQDYYVFDAFVPLVEHDREIPVRRRRSTGSWRRWRRSARTIRRGCGEAFGGRWIDVYENQGKRSGAYSAPVYGAPSVHADELQRHARRGVHARPRARPLDAHDAVARDAAVRLPATRSSSPKCRRRCTRRCCSTIMLDRVTRPRTSASSSCSTPSTASSARSTTRCCSPISSCRPIGWSSRISRSRPKCSARSTRELLERVLGRRARHRRAARRHTWARIPHFFQSPYYVYQYATCFASTAKLDGARFGRLVPAVAQAAAVDRYLTLLHSGGSDHPMQLLKRAGRGPQQARNGPGRSRTARRTCYAPGSRTGLTAARPGGPDRRGADDTVCRAIADDGRPFTGVPHARREGR